MKKVFQVFFLYWPAWREKQYFKIIKTILDKNKTNNKQVRNRITKSDGQQKVLEADKGQEREREK